MDGSGVLTKFTPLTLMKSTLLLTGLFGLASLLSAADAASKDDLLNAAKKLAAAPNYSWRSTTDLGAAANAAGSGRMRPGPTDGRTEKDGVIQLTMVRGDTTTEAFLKGDKAAIKTPEGWKSMTEAADAGGGNPGRFLARMLQGYKVPAVEAQDLLGKLKELSKDGEVWSGDLTTEGAREFLTRGPRRGGGDAPPSLNDRGSVKFWVKDGILTKYELHVQGTMNFNGDSRDIERTTTVEITDVGTTRIEVPEDARKKLS